MELIVSSNLFTGPVPSSLNHLNRLDTLHLFDNTFTGTIPLTLSSFPFLQQVFLQKNEFKGSLNHFFSEYSEEDASSSLVHIDVSGNLLSGTIPSELFRSSSLQTVALSVNCFEHKLPTSICESKNLEVLSMDGLRAARDCDHQISIPFTKVTLGSTLDGSIPECIWNLSKLKVLNLAGNGLKGSISHRFEMISLVNLTLSHNYLSGSIPPWLLRKELHTLDLSHNEFTGDISSLRTIKQSRNSTRSLKLSVNRLSGDLSNQLEVFSSLDILSGNMFSCEYIPHNDQNSQWYVCGSSEYDRALSVMSTIIGLIVLPSILYLLCLSWNRWISPICLKRTKSSNDFRSSHRSSLFLRTFLPSCQQLLNDFHLLCSYCRYHLLEEFKKQEILSDELKIIVSFGSTISKFVNLLFSLTILVIILPLPIYVLKGIDMETDGVDYVTHTHQYRWFLTMAYLSGIIPGTVLLVICFISLSYFDSILNAIDSRRETTRPSDLPSDSKSFNSNFLPTVDRLILVLLVILNAVVVGLVNCLYIYSTLIDLSGPLRIVIQLSLSFFNLIWGVILLNLFPQSMKNSRWSAWLLCTFNVSNSVVIPCIVTALTSPSCYQVEYLIYSPSSL